MNLDWKRSSRISSAHGDGVHTLLDEALKMVPLSPAETEDEIESGQKHIKLAIVGRRTSENRP